MSDPNKTRRTFLSAVGGASVALGVGTAGFTRQGEDPETHYRLGGLTAGWQGREPASIADAVNPTLDLESGTLYAITWINVDGAPHNIAILSENGEVLERTEIITGQGASQTIRFTASEEMATYICQVHPNSMVGDIVVGGASAQTQQTTTGNQTTETIPNPTEAPVTETTHPLADQYGENPVKFRAELQPPEGAQSQASGTTWFTLHPPNGVQAKLMYSLYMRDISEVTGAAIHLDSSGENDPVVMRLFQQDNPTDAIRGTLVDTIVDASDLTGPFEGEPLLRLSEAIRNGNAYVQVQTRSETTQGTATTQNATATQNATTTQTGTTTPSGSTVALRGPIRVVEGGEAQPVTGTTQAGNGTTTVTGDETTATQSDDETTAGNETTQSE